MGYPTRGAYYRLSTGGALDYNQSELTDGRSSKEKCTARLFTELRAGGVTFALPRTKR